jgi:hypothetical protein
MKEMVEWSKLQGTCKKCDYESKSVDFGQIHVGSLRRSTGFCEFWVRANADRSLEPIEEPQEINCNLDPSVDRAFGIDRGGRVYARFIQKAR